MKNLPLLFMSNIESLQRYFLLTTHMMSISSAKTIKLKSRKIWNIFCMFKMFFLRYEAKRNGSYQIGLPLREKSDIMFKNRVNYTKSYKAKLKLENWVKTEHGTNFCFMLFKEKSQNKSKLSQLQNKFLFPHKQKVNNNLVEKGSHGNTSLFLWATFRPIDM